MPETREVKSELPCPPTCTGSSGRPRSAVCTTVPDIVVTLAFCTSTSSSAAVLGGRVGAVSAATEVIAAAPSTMATTAPGTAQRSAGWVVDKAMGISSVLFEYDAELDPILVQAC